MNSSLDLESTLLTDGGTLASFGVSFVSISWRLYFCIKFAEFQGRKQLGYKDSILASKM